MLDTNLVFSGLKSASSGFLCSLTLNQRDRALPHCGRTGQPQPNIQLAGQPSVTCKPLRGVEYPPDGAVRDRLCIDHVTSHLDRIALMFISRLCKRFNGLESGLDQRCTVFGPETGKCPVHPPVCRVKTLAFYLAERLRNFRVILGQPRTLYRRDATISVVQNEPFCFGGSAGLSLHAAYLNSGIFPNGSSAGLVSRLAAASTKAKGMNTMPSGMD